MNLSNCLNYDVLALNNLNSEQFIEVQNKLKNCLNNIKINNEEIVYLQENFDVNIFDLNCNNIINIIEKLEKIEGNFEIFDGENTISKKADLSLPQTIRTLDAFIKEYLDENGGKIDYVHGEENLKKLVKDSKKAVGIFLPKMDKEELFRYVSQSGALPRKTFSMGEGVEKRYYLEGSYIVK